MLASEAHGAFDFGAIVGDSPALRDVLLRVEQVAQTNATVLLRGETGTGKEMVARAIHINSARESRPFIKVNCARWPRRAGIGAVRHEKGAFTGAVARRPDGSSWPRAGAVPGRDRRRPAGRPGQAAARPQSANSSASAAPRPSKSTCGSSRRRIAISSGRSPRYLREDRLPPERLSSVLPPLRDRAGDIACSAVTSCEVRPIVRQGDRVWTRPQDGADRIFMATATSRAGDVIERALILARGPEVTAEDLEFTKRSASGTPVAGPSGRAAVAGGGDGTGTRAGLATVPVLCRKTSDQERVEIVAASISPRATSRMPRVAWASIDRRILPVAKTRPRAPVAMKESRPPLTAPTATADPGRPARCVTGNTMKLLFIMDPRRACRSRVTQRSR